MLKFYFATPIRRTIHIILDRMVISLHFVTVVTPHTCFSLVTVYS